jgi:hypothetical protein
MDAVRHERRIEDGEIDGDALPDERAEDREVVTVKKTDHGVLQDGNDSTRWLSRTGASDDFSRSHAPKSNPVPDSKAIADIM